MPLGWSSNTDDLSSFSLLLVVREILEKQQRLRSAYILLQKDTQRQPGSPLTWPLPPGLLTLPHSSAWLWEFLVKLQSWLLWEYFKNKNSDPMPKRLFWWLWDCGVQTQAEAREGIARGRSLRHHLRCKASRCANLWWPPKHHPCGRPMGWIERNAISFGGWLWRFNYFNRPRVQTFLKMHPIFF